LRILIPAFVALLLVAACGGDEGSGDGTGVPVTAVGTKEPTPEAGTSILGEAGDAPSPVDPDLDEELTEIARDGFDTTLDPGTQYEVDPLSLATSAAASVSCDAFQFDFSWQITDPYPSDTAIVEWFIIRDTGDIKIAGGPSGNQAVGCDILRVVNSSGETVTLSVKYAIGSAG
jgi:hypothetical protein